MLLVIFILSLALVPKSCLFIGNSITQNKLRKHFIVIAEASLPSCPAVSRVHNETTTPGWFIEFVTTNLLFLLKLPSINNAHTSCKRTSALSKLAIHQRGEWKKFKQRQYSHPPLVSFSFHADVIVAWHKSPRKVGREIEISNRYIDCGDHKSLTLLVKLNKLQNFPSVHKFRLRACFQCT